MKTADFFGVYPMLRWSDIALCYLMMRNRLPDDREIADGRRHDFSGLLSELIGTRDCTRQLLLSYFGADPDGRHKRATRAFYDFIGELGESRLAALKRLIEAVPRQPVAGHDYVAFHALRMLELMGFLDRWSRDRQIGSLLDIGLSPFFALYREIIPGIETFLVDYWPHPGDKLNRLGVDGFFRVDLNKQWISAACGGPVERCFDIIVFTEVIEHLLIDPVEALRDLLGLLNPGGIIYFSTPNYLKAGAIDHLLGLCNPQPRYSKAIGNADTHYHLREYTLHELLDAVQQAGGETVFHAYSDCWDRDGRSAAEPEELPIALRSNLILIVSKAHEHANRPDGTAGGAVDVQADAVVRTIAAGLDQVVEIDSGRAGADLDRLSFDDPWYLQHNPDVADAVASGTFSSGWEHYVCYGRKEGRLAQRRLVRIRDRN